MMHLGCNFAKIKLVFVAESYTLISQNISIYFPALRLDARFDAAAKTPKNAGKYRRGNSGTKNLGHGGT